MYLHKAIRTGCFLVIKKDYFCGSWRNPKYDGNAILCIEVIKHSYGVKTNQHTFTLKVLEIIESNSNQTHTINSKILIKGRNLYPSVLDHIQGDESIKDSL